MGRQAPESLFITSTLEVERSMLDVPYPLRDLRKMSPAPPKIKRTAVEGSGAEFDSEISVKKESEARSA
jgi:hypothetical protein